MLKKDLVSIIIPTYNCVNEVEKCIQSVLNQSYDNIEIIIIDDCSSDGTQERIKNLHDKNKIKTFYNSTNKGVSYSRNRGIKEASGKYIMFLDGDDFLEENTIEETLNFAKENNLEIVKFNFVKDIYGISVYNKSVYEHRKIIRDNDFKDIYYKMIKGYAFSSCCFQLIKSSILKNIRFKEDLTYGEDMLFSLELYTIASSFGYYDKPFYHYVIKSNSITRDNNIEKKERILNNSILVYSKYYDYLKKWDMVEFKSEFEKRYIKEIKSCLDQMIISDNYSHFKKICKSINSMKELKNNNIKINYTYAKFIYKKLLLNSKNKMKKIYAKMKGN